MIKLDKLPLIGGLLSGKTVVNPLNVPVPQPAAVESKVAASAGAAGLAGFLLGALSLAQESGLLNRLPSWLRMALFTFGPTVITAVAGYLAPHTDRAAKKSS